MNNSGNVEFEDVQGLVRFGYGKLTETCFMLLTIANVEAAKRWLSVVPISNALETDPPPSTAVQLAFSVQGLRALGVSPALIEQFSDEFIDGMTGDASRSRRLGDIANNKPENWRWGGHAERAPHMLLMLYARQGGLAGLQKSLADLNFTAAFKAPVILPTDDNGLTEPFGFTDGISQPAIDWWQQQSTDTKTRNHYSNLLAVGEVVLGYSNEYGQYTPRPLLDERQNPLAKLLPNAEETPTLKDFGRNGTYLVFRELGQDVPVFWQFIDQAAGGAPAKREQLAAAMVGRNRDGSPLMPEIAETIPGITENEPQNHFTYDVDPSGMLCPLGAHIRRSNPRTADLPPGKSGFLARLLQILGLNQHPSEDLVAATRFHRLLRRGRSYGPKLTPEDAIKPDAPQAERGLQFICLVANISRQFEFVQNAWSMSSKFNAAQHERDPLLGHRESLLDGSVTDHFNRPDPTGPKQTTCALPQFVTVRGGAYFFMPGLRALQYLAALPNQQEQQVS